MRRPGGEGGRPGQERSKERRRTGGERKNLGQEMSDRKILGIAGCTTKKIKFCFLFNSSFICVCFNKCVINSVNQLKYCIMGY